MTTEGREGPATRMMPSFGSSRPSAVMSAGWLLRAAASTACGPSAGAPVGLHALHSRKARLTAATLNGAWACSRRHPSMNAPAFRAHV